MDFTVINANIKDLANNSKRNLKTSSLDSDPTRTQPTQLDPDTIRNLGQDYLQGENSEDNIHVVLVNSFGIELDGGVGDDVLYGGKKFDVLHGRNGNDLLEGFQGNDALYGDQQNDTLQGGKGNDILNGGMGYDRLIESGDVNFTLTNTKLEGQGRDAISQIESAHLAGGAGNNTIDASGATKIETKLTGGAGNDILMGSQMSDSIYGGAGKDVLYGEMGRDTLVGGAKADIFVLESAMGTDIIEDFQDGMDLFNLPNLEFSDLSITDNARGTAALIADMTNSDRLLAVVNNVEDTDITAADFTMI